MKTVSEAIREAMAPELRQRYEAGMRDGAETTLRLLLGEQLSEAPAFDGELPADVEQWARDILAQIQENRPD